MSHRVWLWLSAALIVVVPPAVHGATWYVANHGVDGPTCGPKANPCRSISRAIAQAPTVAGDTIVVGPGRYGDLDIDGVLGEPGEETPTPGCGCMIGVNKGVNLISSHGAASTIIDARSVSVGSNVLLIMSGGEFGRPGKGFTVTLTADDSGRGISIDAQDVAVRGNQVMSVETDTRTGIYTVDGSQNLLVEGNEVQGWAVGIRLGGTAKMVRKNLVTQNVLGIDASGGDVAFNVVTANVRGMVLAGGARASGNAVLGSLHRGISLQPDFSGSVTRNNIVSNGTTGVFNPILNCGLHNTGAVGAIATENYWGAPSGPGTDPADEVCNDPGATTVVSPVAAKAFTVKVPLKQ